MLHMIVLEQRVRQRETERLNEAANERLLHAARRQDAGPAGTLSRLVDHQSPWHEQSKHTPDDTRPISA